ncbi:MAG: hypothetical protein Q4C88_06795 [Akkermansia sp.]|nr:hypothetical protein [Akkermansia sp.]
MNDTLTRIKELAGTLKNALAEHDNEEDKRKEVYDLAETLNQEHHGKLVVALAASHAAKYGVSYLPEKARTWLQRHEWVRTIAIMLLGLAAIWGLTSCASSVKQVQADGSSTERTLIIDGATAAQLIKLYGVPQVPVVNVTK